MEPLINRLRHLVAGAAPIPFASDAGAVELVAMIEAELYGAPSAEFRQAFRVRERQVCKAIRNGRLLLDYRPDDGQGVRLPAVDHPLYAQSLLYWAASLGEPIMRMAEACRLAGEGASPEQVKQAARLIAFEARTMQTDKLHLSGYADEDPPD